MKVFFFLNHMEQIVNTRLGSYMVVWILYVHDGTDRKLVMWDCPPDKDPCQDSMWSDQACWTAKSRGTKGLLESKWVSCMHAATGERNWSMCGSVTKQTLAVVTRGLNTRLLAIVNCETHVKLYTYRGHQPPQHTNSKNPKLWKCTQAC
jgi:hypothetical protein